MTNAANKWIKKKLRELKKEFGGKCARCGSKRKLEFAHKRKTPISGKHRGRKEKYYDIIRHKKSYVLLCFKCHRAKKKKS